MNFAEKFRQFGSGFLGNDPEDPEVFRRNLRLLVSSYWLLSLAQVVNRLESPVVIDTIESVVLPIDQKTAHTTTGYCCLHPRQKRRHNQTETTWQFFRFNQGDLDRASIRAFLDTSRQVPDS